jgi:hypothetical protein
LGLGLKVETLPTTFWNALTNYSVISARSITVTTVRILWRLDTAGLS